jgi:hypothetical protein
VATDDASEWASLGRAQLNDVIDLGRRVEAIVTLEGGGELHSAGPTAPPWASGSVVEVALRVAAVQVWRPAETPPQAPG